LIDVGWGSACKLSKSGREMKNISRFFCNFFCSFYLIWQIHYLALLTDANGEFAALFSTHQNSSNTWGIKWCVERLKIVKDSLVSFQ